MTTETPLVSTPLVSLTPKATDKLREVLSKQERQDLALRVYGTPGGCSELPHVMTFADGPEEEDATVVPDDARIVGHAISVVYVKGAERDFIDRVNDLEGVTAKLQAEGIDVPDEGYQDENCRFAWITDPEGQRIELWEPAPGH